MHFNCIGLIKPLTCFVMFFISYFVSAQNIDSIALNYANSISKESLKDNLTIIASDEYEGRETGKKGQKMAADFIAKQFMLAGIPPINRKEYFQNFLLDEKQPVETRMFVNKKEYVNNKDFYCFPGDIKKEKVKTKKILFLGYGIEDKNYNDYKDVNVKNKTIIILSGEPINKDSISLVTAHKTKSGWHNKAKIKIAKEKGVKTILIVKEDIEQELINHKQKIQSTSLILKGEKHQTSVVYVSKEIANEILKTVSVEELKDKILFTKEPQKIWAHQNLNIKTKSYDRQISTQNVLGYIEGGDLKNELIVLSAHYDHLGIKDNKVFNGADDDGSGTVALIELAKVFAKAKKEGHGPRRSILFIAFSGEEKGLLGSSYYTEHPEFALSKTVCDLNMDMIGRLDEKHQNNPNYIYLIGSDKLSSELHQISETINKAYTHLQLDYTYNDEKDVNRFYYRSDHYNFAKNGVPVIFYFNGVHDDYHKESDKVEKINFEKIKKISTLVFLTAWELANREERIKVDSNKK